LGLLTCKTVSQITYTVLVETLNTSQSISQSVVETDRHFSSVSSIYLYPSKLLKLTDSMLLWTYRNFSSVPKCRGFPARALSRTVFFSVLWWCKNTQHLPVWRQLASFEFSLFRP